MQRGSNGMKELSNAMSSMFFTGRHLLGFLRVNVWTLSFCGFQVAGKNSGTEVMGSWQKPNSENHTWNMKQETSGSWSGLFSLFCSSILLSPFQEYMGPYFRVKLFFDNACCFMLSLFLSLSLSVDKQKIVTWHLASCICFLGESNKNIFSLFA